MPAFRRIVNGISRRIVYPLLPESWRLPYAYWKSIWDGSCEPELRYLRSFCKPGEAAVDVGANTGHYSYALSKLFNKVYAFETNRELTLDLRNYSANRIELFDCGLSSAKAQTTLYIPVADGLALNGWGTLNPKSLPNTTEILEMAVTVNPLDDYKLENISFMKIDVEGHEPEVLAGASNTIDRCRPTMLLEVKEENKPKIDMFFIARQYCALTLRDLIRLPGSAENLILVPIEKREETYRIANSTRRARRHARPLGQYGREDHSVHSSAQIARKA